MAQYDPVANSGTRQTQRIKTLINAVTIQNDTDKMVEMVFGSKKFFWDFDKVTGMAVRSQMACVKCYVLVSKVWFFALKTIRLR